MKKILLMAVIAASLAFTVDHDDHGKKKGFIKGPTVKVHGGQSWTWVQLDKKGNPEQIGITLTDEVLNTVPSGGGHGHAHGTGNSWALSFSPVAGAVIPFNHVGLNWNPNGHEPEHIYGRPHFDFHFNTQTPEEVDAIPVYEADSLKFNNWPSQDYFPADYFNPGGGVPKMGAHWVDIKSLEFHGKPFTETFIFGSYDGKVTFYEPMITLEFLKSHTNYERAIPTPAKFQETGWYPTVMKVVKHDQQTDIILDKFVYRTKS